MTLLRCYRINTLVTEWRWHLIQCVGRICHQNLSFAALVEECVAFNQKVEAVWRMHLHVVPSKQVAHEQLCNGCKLFLDVSCASLPPQ